jgi:U4/U6 small nuclear ribonucleoprotein PRP31
MLEYIEGQMAVIAPNVTAIVGSAIASQLVGLAGGVKQLAIIPSGNIQVLGNARKELAGLSFASTGLHTGVITESDLVQNTAPQWRKQAIRLVSGKLSLAARIDAQPDKKGGAIGREYRLEIVRKLEKIAEAAPGTLEKTIPPPPMEAKKRRGGKRARRQKELVALTQARKLQNRVAFGEAETEVVVGSSVMGMGMLSKANASTLRMAPADNKGREAIKKAAQKKTMGFFSNDAPTSANAPASPKPKVEPETSSKYFGSSTSFRT